MATAALTADAGQAQIQAQLGGATLVCLRYEDTDADGAPEWLALAHQTEPRQRLQAFILDGEAHYPLDSAAPEPGDPDVGLGAYRTCEVEVRDINVDGRPEIAIWGHAEGNKTLLHVYAWEGERYRRMGDFAGTAGVRFEDADGDLAEEIVVGYRDQGAPDLAWYVIHTWDGLTYGWTSDRYDWYTLARPHSLITHKPIYAVASFYLALDDRDLPGAYALMTADAQAANPYEVWALGFATTLQVQVGDIHTIPGTTSDTYARVAAMVTAWDNEGGRVAVRLWNVEWDTYLTAEGWRLGGGTMRQLDEWDAPYWP